MFVVCVCCVVISKLKFHFTRTECRSHRGRFRICVSTRKQLNILCTLRKLRIIKLPIYYRKKVRCNHVQKEKFVAFRREHKDVALAELGPARSVDQWKTVGNRPFLYYTAYKFVYKGEIMNLQAIFQTL